MPQAESALVSAEWLKAHLGDPDLRVIEATWYPDWISRDTSARQEYAEGHIPGAAFFDIDEIADPDTDLPHMLPSAVMFSSRLRKLGIGDGHRILVYDRNGLMAAARAWWMLRTMGHSEVYVLDGGWQDWLASGGEIEDLPPVPSERHHTARVNGELIRTLEQVRQDIAGREVQILDARPAGRFDGTAPEPRDGIRSGHMPGAINVPTSDIIADGRLKREEALRKAFTAAGWTPGKRTVTSCGSGVTAAILALALHELGEEKVSVYDGSWAEWASHPDNPIETSA